MFTPWTPSNSRKLALVKIETKVLRIWQLWSLSIFSMCFRSIQWCHTGISEFRNYILSSVLAVEWNGSIPLKWSKNMPVIWLLWTIATSQPPAPAFWFLHKKGCPVFSLSSPECQWGQRSLKEHSEVWHPFICQTGCRVAKHPVRPSILSLNTCLLSDRHMQTGYGG